MKRSPKDKKETDKVDSTHRVNDPWKCKPGRWKYPDGSELIIDKDGNFILIEAQVEYKPTTNVPDE